MASIDIQPQRNLQGTLRVPGDKSISHRALMFGALAEGTTRITGLLKGEDVLATQKILQQLGVEIAQEGDAVIVQGKGLQGFKAPTDVLYCGNSGTTMRLMLGLLSAQSFNSMLTGDASLNKRPMKRVMDPLSQMGAQFKIKNADGQRLIEVLGQTRPTSQTSPTGQTSQIFELPVASAQVKTALLLAALVSQTPLKIKEPSLSRDHSERMLTAMGAALSPSDGWIVLEPTKTLNPLDITVPADFSSAAFLIVAGLICPNSQLTVSSVLVNPTRSALLDVLMQMGAQINIVNKRQVSGEEVADITVTSSELKAVEVKGDIIPKLIDEIPILALAASFAKGTTVIRDAGELRVKESDRIATTATELRKAGVQVKELEDGLEITGPCVFKPGTFDSYGDHRIAMSLAIGSLTAEAASTIENCDCVNTSFPGFFDLLTNLTPQP